MHYKCSFPFYRLEQLSKQLFVPLARSTLWLRMEELANDAYPIWSQLLADASEGDLFYIDDTKAKILSLMAENELNRENKKERKGIYTTGILSELGKDRIILYLTGRNHPGENLKSILEKRDSLEPIAIMSDALAANNIDIQKEILRYLCLTHGRRHVADLDKKFDDLKMPILDKIGVVYKNDKHCKENQLSPNDRLLYHQTHSGQVMIELKAHIDKLFQDKAVEPNSSLGQGIKYVQKQWQGLTAFLRHPGAPLDNNILEANLRVPVLNRKNWLFFKNEYGALVGDILLSIIKTCELNGKNPYEYLIAIQKNQKSLKENPTAWLPWNYLATLSNLEFKENNLG